MYGVRFFNKIKLIIVAKNIRFYVLLNKRFEKTQTIPQSWQIQLQSSTIRS